MGLCNFNPHAISINDCLDYLTDDQIAWHDGFDFKSVTKINLFEHANVRSDFTHIPQISHAIWLANVENPKEMPQDNIDQLMNKWSLLSKGSSNWIHYLWTNCKKCIPETIQQFKANGFVIHELHESNLEAEAIHLIEKNVHERLFGIASDFTRIALLKDYGGLYSDLNYQFEYHPSEEMRRYDFFAHSDPDGFYVDVYMLGAKPHHPIIEEAYTRIFQRLNLPADWLDFSKKHQNIQDYTRIMSYLPFNWAVFNHFNQQTCDFVFPIEHQAPCPKEMRTCYHTKSDLYDYWQEPNFFEGSSPSFIDAIEVHFSQLICMENILGHDGANGGTWYRI